MGGARGAAVRYAPLVPAGCRWPVCLAVGGLLVALLLAGCGVPLVRQTRYAGTRIDCATGRQASASLVRAGDRLSFAPDDGALVIPAALAPDGSFSGSLVTSQQRPEHGGPPVAWTLSVDGRLTADAAVSTYATPRSRGDFRLPRVPLRLLP
jgi:hypothetical protein